MEKTEERANTALDNLRDKIDSILGVVRSCQKLGERNSTEITSAISEIVMWRLVMEQLEKKIDVLVADLRRREQTRETKP